MEIPDFTTKNKVFQDMLAQLKKSADALPSTQARMMSVTGVSWSDDRMVKVVVGPRGQLVDLEIDPRVFRRPDAAELRAKILGAANDAVRKVTEQVQEIVSEQLPPDMAEWRDRHAPDGSAEKGGYFRGDAETYAERKGEL